MTSAYVLAQLVEREPEIVNGIAEWELRERGFIQWVQRVAYWYGQLAFLRPGARTAIFKAVDGSEWLKRRTLLAAACRDPTAIPPRVEEVMADAAMHFLIH
jgi:hypothetical protein